MTITVVAIASGAYAALVLWMYVIQRQLLYVPAPYLPAPEAVGLSEMRPVTLATADGLQLASWYRAAREGRPTIVYVHGNGGHIGTRAEHVRPYLEAGYGLLLVEYRGYGGNPGTPTEEGLYADARAGLAFVRAQGVEAHRIVLYGESLGSGVAVHLARDQAETETPVGAVVLEAPLSSAVEVGAHHYPYLPVRLLLKDRFQSRDKIAGIAAPLFIVHGESDRVVPVRFGRRLFAAAEEPKEAWWVPGADHEDLEEFGLSRAVMAFLSRYLSRPEIREPQQSRPASPPSS